MPTCASCSAVLTPGWNYCTACGNSTIPAAIRPEPVAAHRWREPTSLLPLRWGTHTGRYLAGLLLVVGGVIQVQGSNVWALPLLLVGTLAQAVGWSILPASGWRRLLVIVPAVGQAWVLLAGPQAIWSIVIPYLAWLLVRHRPLRSYLTAVFPAAAGILLAQSFREYSGMPVALAIAMAVLVASAWLARLIAVSARVPSQSAANID